MKSLMSASFPMGFMFLKPIVETGSMRLSLSRISLMDDLIRIEKAIQKYIKAGKVDLWYRKNELCYEHTNN